ncbi:MAG: hypothetical protein ABUK01_01830 [Leptospirales bacterium]
MSAVKEKFIEIINEQPEDSTPEEIIKELAFSNIVERGLLDVEEGNTISNIEMKNRIDKQWK